MSLSIAALILAAAAALIPKHARVLTLAGVAILLWDIVRDRRRAEQERQAALSGL